MKEGRGRGGVYARAVTIPNNRISVDTQYFNSDDVVIGLSHLLFEAFDCITINDSLEFDIMCTKCPSGTRPSGEYRAISSECNEILQV